MPSIRGLRDRKRRRRFTGRQAELSTFRQLLSADEAEYAILHLYGVGGVGKTSLLEQFRRLAQEMGYPTALVDLQVQYGVVEVLRTIRSQVEGRQFAEFDKALDVYNDVQSKLQSAVGSLSSGIISGIREGAPFGLGALAVDTIGEERVKSWLYQHLPRPNADLYLHGDRILTGRLIEGLNALAAGEGKVVLFFDTYEEGSGAQDDWLRDVLLDSDLSSDVVLVIAGRDRLAGRWREWHEIVLSLEVRPFTDGEAREYLAYRGVTEPEVMETLLALTEHLPWALALITDIPDVGSMTVADFGSAPYRHLIGDKVVERFTSQVQDDAEMRELVEVCAVTRNFDHDVTRTVWGREDVEGPLDRLRRFSFVRVREDGRWSLHSVVREFLDRGFRRRSPQQWAELNRRATDFYRQRAEAWPQYSDEWRWLTLESLYHLLQMREDEGMNRFAHLFEEAKRFSKYDFCSELLNNVKDVKLQRPASRRWLQFYGGKMARAVDTFAWGRAHEVNRALYGQPDLSPDLRAKVTADLGRYYYHISGEYQSAIAVLEESLALRQRLGDRGGQAYVLGHLAMACAAVGDLDEGREHGQACVQLAETLDDPYRLGWGHFSLGVVETYAQAWPEALACFRRSFDAFQAAGFEFELGVVHHRLGQVCTQMGDWPEALKRYRASLDLMRKYEKPALALRTLVDVCGLHLARGDAAALAADAAEAERLSAEQCNDTQLARLRLLQARAALAQPTPDAGAVADLYVDACLAAARSPCRAMLGEVAEQIDERLERLADGGRAELAGAVRRQVDVGHFAG